MSNCTPRICIIKSEVYGHDKEGMFYGLETRFDLDGPGWGNVRRSGLHTRDTTRTPPGHHPDRIRAAFDGVD
ncbi:hypothetical protein L6452_02479 [Arctium lappa]|uniref:Uncharacterized protein n=1 Tax=Arctium lappa TaxID=4217 RepID=A0ACB9FJH4_ARCLA|nr:hypothetical protein L6452_02479 [Arctium lappa]